MGFHAACEMGASLHVCICSHVRKNLACIDALKKKKNEEKKQFLIKLGNFHTRFIEDENQNLDKRRGLIGDFFNMI